MEHYEAYNEYIQSQLRVLTGESEVEHLTSLFANLPYLKEIELAGNVEDENSIYNTASEVLPDMYTLHHMHNPL